MKGRIAFGTILTVVVFSAWIRLFIFDPDSDEFGVWHSISTVVGMLEHVAFVALAMKFLIGIGVI